MRAIYKKEVLSFFRSMAGYVYLAFFLLVAGIFFMSFNLQGGVAEFGYVLGNTTTVLLIVVPILTMRLLSEEQKQKTDQLLFTAPVKVWEIVIGKYLAALTIFAAPLAVLVFCPLVLSMYGQVPLKESYSCFLAFLFMGGACLAVGLFVSSLTDHPVLAAVGTFALLLFSYLSEGIGKLAGNLGRFMGAFSIFQRYYDFVDGMFDLTHLVYYLSVIFLLLLLTVYSVKRRRKPLKGGYHAAMCVLAAAIAVLANLSAGQLPSRYMKFDTSSTEIYSLSSQTKELAAALTQPVNLYLIAPKGQEDEVLTRLLSRYEDLSGQISVEYVDPVLSPDFVSQYTSNKVSDNSILAVSGERVRVVRNSDLYPSSYDYETGGIASYFDGEGQITGAIRYVTTEEIATLYALTGHGENELTESLEGALEKEGIQVKSLNLTAAANVPADGDGLLLNVPVSDLTSQEEEAVSAYLQQGGKLLLMTGISAAEQKHLWNLMSAYGLEPQQGMILETDGNYAVPSYPNFLLPQMASDSITDPLVQENALVLFPNAHGIGIMEDRRSTVEVKGLLKTSPKSYLKTDTSTLSYEEGDLTGPFNVMASASEATAYGETRIIWASSSTLLTEEMDEMVGGNNTDLLLNSLGWLLEQEDKISIRPKRSGAQPLRLTASQASAWGGLFVLVIPGAIIGLGAAVCIRRRRRQ